MSASSGFTIRAELIGGPHDGDVLDVPLPEDPDHNVFLFRRADPPAAGQVAAYAYRGRSLHNGKLWALEFLHIVGKIGSTKKP